MSAGYDFGEDWFSEFTLPNFAKLLPPLAGTPCRLLEIGSYEGRSTTWLVDNLMEHPDARLDCLDISIQPRLRGNLEKTGRDGKVTLHEGRSREILRRLPPNAYDFVFVDGGHGTIEVLEDLVLSFRLAKPDALICCDDYGWDVPPLNRFGTPKLAIEVFLQLYAQPERHEPLVKFVPTDTLWQVWLRKLKDEPEEFHPDFVSPSNFMRSA